MEPLKPKSRQGPEAKIQAAIVKALTLRGWFVLETHGNMYQMGLPDLFATHRSYGGRWIEVKNKESYRFTPAQLETFPKMVANGTPVWVLVGDDQSELDKLHKICNWAFYL